MYHDDEDLHMCIYCHATIVGLENYISHRNAGPCKQQTPVKENEAPIPVLPPLGMPKSEHIRSLPSATTPSGGDHLNFLNADFFFSSLELQSRRKDVVFEEVMGIEEVLEEEFEERESQGMVHVGGGKWGYEDYVQERDVWGSMDEKGRDIGEIEREDLEGGHSTNKSSVKKGEGKNVNEDKDISRKRQLRASSEMEENHPDFIEGLGSGADFSLGESSSKCHLPTRETLLPSRTQDFHGSSDAGSCNSNSFSLSLGGCGMDVGNPGHKDDDGSYERNCAAPPQNHTRGKWVPGLASEGMRKAGNAVEYFCQPCNKNIRNRRSYETHLSTLCHLKKLMSSSNDKISADTTKGPRLRSRRLQVTKSKDASIKAEPAVPSLNKHLAINDGSELSSTSDLNSQNYLMESLGIKRKVALPVSDGKNCGSVKVREAITGDNFSPSSDKRKKETCSSQSQNAKKNVKAKKSINRKNKRKSKLRKGISKIHKEPGLPVDSHKDLKDGIPYHSNADPEAKNVGTNCGLKILKKYGNNYQLNDDKGNSKDSKSLFVEEKTGLIVEDKFLPISDPHISHGNCYDSFEVQEKQKKLKGKIDLEKQRCESNSLNSSENLQDQMMLGLELMRTEHLSSSSDKLESKGKSLCRDENADMRNESLAQASSDGTINPKLLSYDICGREKAEEVMDENSPEIRKEDLNHPLGNLVDDEICGTNNEMVFVGGKLSCTSIKTHSETESYGKNGNTAFVNHDSVSDGKSSQQSEETSNSFFNSVMTSSQSAEFIKTAKDENKISEEHRLSKFCKPHGTNSVDIVLRDDLVLNSPKQGQNFLIVKLLKMRNLSMNASKYISDDLLKNLVDFTCGGKNSKLEERSVNKSEVHTSHPDYLPYGGNSSASNENTREGNGDLSNSVVNLSHWGKCNPKLCIVKQNVKQIHQIVVKDNVNELKGKILIINKSTLKKPENLHYSLPGMKFQGEKLKEDCDRLNEMKMCLQPQQALVYQLVKPETNPSKTNATSQGACMIGEVSKSDVCEKIVDDSYKYSMYESSKRTTMENVVLGIASSEFSPEMSFVEGNLQRDRFHGGSLRTIPESNLEQTGCDIDDVSNVHCAKRDDLISSDDQVAHEEVIESSQPYEDTCPTVNVVINVKSMTSKNDQFCNNLVSNDPVENDVAGSSSSKYNSSQYSSFSLEELQPSRTLAPNNDEKLQILNSSDSIYGAKYLEKESGEQIHISECRSESDCVNEQSASECMKGSDILDVTANGRVITEQGEPGKGIQYSCQLCKYKSDRYWCVERHMKKHFPRDRPYSCNKCSLSFLTMDNLKQHLKRHKKRRWCCSVKNCSQAFYTKQELLAHISGPHVEEKSFRCNLCDYCGKNLPALIRHKKVHEEQATEKCESCAQVCKKGSLSRHMKMHGKNDLYHCPFCSFTSYYLTSVHRHITQSGLHPDKMLYNCPFCIVVEEDLEKHKEMEHSYCMTSSAFSSDSIHEIMNHINSAHKEEKLYSYLYSSVTEIIRRIHTLLGIIHLSDG